jgi:hypothetical protein
MAMRTLFHRRDLVFIHEYDTSAGDFLEDILASNPNPSLTVF